MTPRLLLAALALTALSACRTTAPADAPAAPVSSTAGVDYATLQTYRFEEDVRPLLIARDVLASSATQTPGDPARYTLDAVLMAGPSGFVVPFDPEGSLLVRFVDDLPGDAAIPFPNLRRLAPAELEYLKRWIDDGVRDASGRPAFADAHDLLFAGVQGENHVAIVDAMSLRIVRRVYFADHGIPSAPYGPHHFTFEPDGSAWYASLVSAGVVAKLSLDLSLDPSDPAFLLGRTPAGAFATPGMLALDPTSSRLVVGRSTLSDPLASGFAVVDRQTMAVETIATPFNVPHAMALTPDGRFALTAELTGSQAVSRLAVYDTASGDLRLVPLPAQGTPRELIHFSILGPHMMAAMGMGGMDHAGMDHAGMDHAGMDPDAAMGEGYPYTVTLTSRSSDEVLFLSLAEDGTLTFVASAPAGDGPYHAHAGHDGRTLLIPDQRGDTVTLVDAQTRETVRSIALSAPAGPLSQPHSPAPGMHGDRFFVTSSNLDGAWTPPFLFAGPDGQPREAKAFGNLAAVSMDGTLLGTVQLGAYPSGLEPFILSHEHDASHDRSHDGMDHGSHDGMMP